MKPRFSSNAAIAATLVALLLLGASLLPYLRASTEAVRLRNALLFQPSTPADFNWTPDSVPPSFAVDRSVPRTTLSDVTAKLLAEPAASEWDKALRIGQHLIVQARRGGPAKADLEGTYQTIMAGGGYCADFTTVFMAMARSAGIFAREWAFSFDGYGGHGHALIDIYDRRSGQWRMLDVFNNFYATDAGGRPLSALEFREHVKSGQGQVLIQRISNLGRDGFRDTEALYRYYRDGADQWYLWWGNAVYAYDDSFASRTFGPLSRSAEQLVAVATGVHPKIHALPTPSNQGLRDAAHRLHWRLLATGALGVILALVLIAQLVARWRARSRHA
jgi:hypothetical protein